MQTTGAALLAVEQHSLSCTRLLAQDGRSAHGLLYFTAVWDDSCQQGSDASRASPRSAVNPKLTP